MDTYSQQIGYSAPGVVTGKPIVLGGTVGRREATGLGVVYVLEAVCDRIGLDLRGSRVAIQGFGNVGGVVSAGGLDIAALDSWVAEHGSLAGYPDAEHVGPADVLEVPCEVVIPAAVSRQITAENAARLDCRVVIEAANGPTTTEAEEILLKRGIPVIPDVLANAGGVTVSYFEWVQDQQRYSWDALDIQERLRRQMRFAFGRVTDAIDRLGVDWRMAALSVAIERVAEAARLRGIYP